MGEAAAPALTRGMGAVPVVSTGFEESIRAHVRATRGECCAVSGLQSPRVRAQKHNTQDALNETYYIDRKLEAHKTTHFGILQGSPGQPYP